MNQVLEYTDINKFIELKQIDKGPFSQTSLAMHKETQEKFSQRLIHIKQEETITKFKDICEKLFNMQYPYSIRSSYAVLPQFTNNTPAALYTHYAENQSLKDLVQKLEKGEVIENFYSTQKLIIIHGILLFLNSIHQANQSHGRIKVSNIFLDSQLLPLVSDAFLYNLNENGPINDSNNEMIDYIVSIPPELLQNKDYTFKSDIYSFGILTLQILTNRINVYVDKTIKCSEIIQLKQNGHLPNLSDVKNQKLRDIISQCLDSDPEKRPTTNKIIDTIKKIEDDENEYDIQRLNKFKSINNVSTDDLKNQDFMEMKKLADEGNVDMMYKYGRKMLIGEDDCPCDVQEAKKYISMAAEKGHEKAKTLFLIIFNNDETKHELEEEQDPSSIESIHQIKGITHLKDDQFFTREKDDLPFIIEKVKENYVAINKHTICFTKEKYGKKNFIFTEGANKRLTKLYYYLKSGVPVLLEGPTGTSKTFSSEIISILLQKQLLKINFSAETNASDLLGRYKSDVNSWAGLSMTMGPFINAFESGYILLLDNINLANANCLKFIGDAIDSKKISVEMPGMPLKEIPMHREFRLIATQNPNKGLFEQKRQDLDHDFLSRFQIVDFPSFDKDELIKIAEGLVKSFNYDVSDKFIQDLIDFHMIWSSREDVKNDVQCFTIREIAATIHALSLGNNCYDTIMTIYGARYKKRKKNELEKLFLSYESLKDMRPSRFEYPDNFPKCFHNKNLEEALKAIQFSFDNKRHVILTGSEGSGITQVARWIAKHYNNKNNKNLNNLNDEFFCICTEETKCSNLIGTQTISYNMESVQDLIDFKLGILSLAIEQGKCIVLDSINEIPSIICERLNSLLDEKYDGERKILEIPENSKQESIEIDPDFRMLCTCRIDKINQMSPAFINRFNVIVLEDQLEDITDAKLKELIELLMTIKFISSTDLNSDSNDNNRINNDHDLSLEVGDDDDFSFVDDDDLSFVDDDGFSLEEDNEPENKEMVNNEQENQNTNKTEFKPPSDLVDLVFNSFNQIKNNAASNDDKIATMYKLSQLCKAISKYVNYFSNSPEITYEIIVKFSTDFLMKTNNFDIPKEIENFFRNKLIDANNDVCPYFFADSPPLCSYIAKLYAASVINQPLIVIGETGVGKTSSARAFGRLRRNQQNSNLQCLMLSFHAGTKSNNIYGIKSILNGKVAYINGPLTLALQKGGTFIADEMDLSTISTIKSLAPALEPCIGEKVFISSIGESVKIHSDFFFIACQTEQNVIPSSIASRFRILYYPQQQEEDLSKIRINIAKSFYIDPSVYSSFSVEDARNVGKYMISLNQIKQKIIPQWSLWDITKFFKRIHHQDEKTDYYHNVSFYHNVLFYTLAPVDKSELEEIFPTILNLIGDIFCLNTESRNKLKESYETEASIQNFGMGPYIMKGKTGISTSLLPNFEYIIEFAVLPSLLECIFKILLSDSSESILLIGPSGYKTFISKQILHNVKVISLTHDISVSQLIGSSVLFTKSESKLFYLDLICRICHIYDVNKISELKDKLLKEKLTKFDILDETKKYLSCYWEFSTEIYYLTEKLLYDSTNNVQSTLSDMVIEFNPGLILLPILQGESVILKNLSNIQTNVIERLNELIKHNNITESGLKKLPCFGLFSRIFGTCHSNSVFKLPEAVLSLFTVINIPEYTNDEQRNVLKSYNIINTLKLSNEIIDLIIDFSNSLKKHLKRTISFTQLINILEICSKLLLNNSSIPPKKILGIVLYRIFIGLLEKRTKYKEKIFTIFSEINVPLPSQFLNPINKSPFLVTNKNGFQGLESTITGFFIASTDAKKVDMNVAYTPSFVDMLDIIHFGILTKIPVILEGNAGQGKQKAIEYVAKHLGYEINNIFLSKSTRIDYLLGKLSNVTKLAKAIKSNSENNKSIFVLHNLNNASPAFLEKLAFLIDRTQREFLFSDDETYPKGDINVIGIFNPQNDISNREKLPTSLIHSSIYHIVENPTKIDVLQIAEALFKPTNFKYELIRFFEKFQITKKFSSHNITSSTVSLYDINKYIRFRTVTDGFIDEDLIYQMLFGYRFWQQETINQALNELDLLKMSFHPKFIFNDEKKEIYIKESDDSKSLTLKIQSKLNFEQIIQELTALTIEQQQCLLVLACAVLSKQACIIQGSTASGKSHIIRLFANMLGRKLNVYQMNCDSGISILTGQSILRNEVTEKDKKELQLAFSDLQNFDEIKEFISENFSIPYKDWSPKQFSELLILINNYEKEHTITEDKKELLKRAETKIKQAFSPAKRFNHEESAFIKAMENGEWVVFEDIGSAPPEIEEKLSSLCGNDPEIDLFESGENHFFSRNKPNSRKIHEDFQVFIIIHHQKQDLESWILILLINAFHLLFHH